MLVLVAAVTLAVGGVGIMNIMLANVRSRIREIGIRKALGATYREIKLQFLTEAVLISLTGGVVGSIVGLALAAFHPSLHRLRFSHLVAFRADCNGRGHRGRRRLRHRSRHARGADGSRGCPQV